jgi:DNA-directed RNA polymerase subunit RPC12/RpoP
MIKFTCGACKSEVEKSKDEGIGCPVCGLGITTSPVVTYPPYIPTPTYPYLIYPGPIWVIPYDQWSLPYTITCTTNSLDQDDASNTFFNTPYEYSTTSLMS